MLFKIITNTYKEETAAITEFRKYTYEVDT